MSIDYKSFIDSIWFERRDIISNGYDRAIDYIKTILPEMKIHKYKSGEEAWTWIIPEKWGVKNAYIKSGNKILLDLKDHPLNVMSYSTPISGKVSKDELLEHLHYRKEYPDSIPFEFSYYHKNWGFCIEFNRLKDLVYDEYDVLIDSKFEEGELKVGEIYIPGTIEKEIILMAHLCHPCMVDDGLSAVAVLVNIAKYFIKRSNNYYSYRFLIVPETIGSIAYLSKNEHLIEKMEFGFSLDMLGHDDQLSLQKSKQGSTLIDRAAEICLKESGLEYRVGEYQEVVGNDEKIFNGPGVNIPSISLTRANFWGRGEWPYSQYHSSSDTPDIISIEKLKEAESIVINIFEILDQNYYPKAIVKGPIFLSRYGLWVDWRVNRELNLKQSEVLYYLNESRKTLVDIAYELAIPFNVLKEWLDKFFENNLIEKKNILD